MSPHSPTRNGFTLLEMMVAMVIFSLITVFLYRSLDTLRDATHFYGESLDLQQRQTRMLKTLFLDLVQSENSSIKIIDDEQQSDTLLMQTSHSVHRRIMPYVGYTVRQGALYRFEALQPPVIPLEPSEHMIVDKLEAIERFRIYDNTTHFLVDLRFKDATEQLMKIPRNGMQPDSTSESNVSEAPVL